MGAGAHGPLTPKPCGCKYENAFDCAEKRTLDRIPCSCACHRNKSSKDVSGPPFTVPRYGSLGETILAERDWLLAAFKNFHRLLCERFDYAHDEQDWQRDQLSLIEWIAKRSAGETTTELDRLREIIETRCVNGASLSLIEKLRHALDCRDEWSRRLNESAVKTSRDAEMCRCGKYPKGLGHICTADPRR